MTKREVEQLKVKCDILERVLRLIRVTGDRRASYWAFRALQYANDDSFLSEGKLSRGAKLRIAKARNALRKQNGR